MRNFTKKTTVLFILILFKFTFSANALDISVPLGGDIQAAIDEVADSGGGNVILSSGTYIVNSTIKIKSNVSIIGAGMEDTIIQSSGPFTIINQFGEGQSNMVIKDLTVIGENNENCFGILIESLNTYHNNVTLQSVKVRNSGMGVHLKGIYGVLVKDCDISFNGAPGQEGYFHNLYLRRCYTNVSIENCKLNYSSTGNGFNASYSSNIIIKNTEAIGNYFRGMRAADTDGFTIENCVASYNGDYGLVANSEVNPTTNINWSGNCVSNNENIGVYATTGVTGSCNNNNAFENSTDYSLPGTITQSGNITDNTQLCVTNPINQKPTTSITSPENGTVFTTPTNVTVTVDAIDNDGSITKVEYYNGTEKLGVSNVAPFSLSLNNLEVGNYILKAMAFDNLGSYTVSSDVSISVIDSNTTEYTVNISPDADAFVRGGTYGNANYGSETTLLIKSSSDNFTRKVIMKFDLSSIEGTISSAILKLNVKGMSSNVNCSIYQVSDDSWTEPTVTWNNVPSQGQELLKKALSTSNVGSYVEFDLTNYIQSEHGGDNQASFILFDPDHTDITYDFYSKENSTNRPLLEIVYNKTLSADFSEINNNLKIYPNPTNDYLNVYQDKPESLNIEVVDYQGRTVIQKTLVNKIEKLDLSNVSSGLYLIKLKKHNNTIVKKIVKK